ncbi:hypothetical protein BCR34DRAFT_355199 [Clohesyomyces aquaticus]|uniref:Uncharacterized protein n=1 Tax=Clohesyomyces aquaticus TaxID=1231657 RepID=A0A1Y1ZIU8_9PLEO|nr:hypothetical protein BCR34DRAFT_355199 [Clohesyomyces aquaticus]
MARKKKPAANPARGFATTSIASKPKLEKAVESEVKELAKESAIEPSKASELLEKKQTQPEVAEKTPEELEAQLEQDELQLLVEKHAAKTRREARRQVSKIHTDRRVLRPQAELMSVRDWLPSEILDSIIALAQEESNDLNRRAGQKSLLKVLQEEDAIARLWTLDLILSDLGFSHENVQPVMKWLCANAVTIDPTAAVWGFQEGLEWLALDQCQGNTFSYEEQRPKRLIADSPSVSRPETPITHVAMGSEFESAHVMSSGNRQSSNPTLDVTTPRVLTPAPSDHSDATISDLDSDIEPDQLIPTYLKIKSKLFEMDPDALEGGGRRQPKSSKGKKPMPHPKGAPAAIRKLRAQLQQLEADALFDQYEADGQWPALRNQIAQNKIVDRQRQPLQPAEGTRKEDTIAPQPTNSDIQAEGVTFGHNESSDDEGSGLLGDMFGAIPSDAPVTGTEGNKTTSSSTILRDFGKQLGLAPRKLLEETVRARYGL